MALTTDRPQPDTHAAGIAAEPLVTPIEVLRLWFPLAVSFGLMMLEGPAFQAAIGRLPAAPLNFAAWGLAMSISLLIESPVIMLLGTSIALVRDRPAYRALRRFVLALCGLCTIVSGLVAFTPVYDLVARTAMGQPADIVEAARPAMAIMLFWTAAIGWRRFTQGALVRHGHTRFVSYGTAVRLTFAVGTAWFLTARQAMPGVQVAAVAIMAAVVSEAIATTLFAAPILRRELAPTPNDGAPPLTQRAILRFHLPLAATTLLTLLAQPITSAALARLPNPKDSLAAWPVAFGSLMVLRGAGFAYQEIAVARGKDPRAQAALRAVAWLLGLSGTAACVLALVTPALRFYLTAVIELPPNLHALTVTGVAVGCALPLVTALGSWVRGLLISHGHTPVIYRAMMVNLASHGVLLVTGVAMRLPAMWLASGAFTLAAFVEYAYLLAQARRHG